MARDSCEIFSLLRKMIITSHWGGSVCGQPSVTRLICHVLEGDIVELSKKKDFGEMYC